MPGTLQRTEQVITVAELREMLDDQDAKSFANVTSRALPRFVAAPGVSSRTTAGASGRTQAGRMMINTGCRDVRFGPLRGKSASRQSL
jgi:hypothetical protein